MSSARRPDTPLAEPRSSSLSSERSGAASAAGSGPDMAATEEEGRCQHTFASNINHTSRFSLTGGRSDYFTCRTVDTMSPNVAVMSVRQSRTDLHRLFDQRSLETKPPAELTNPLARIDKLEQSAAVELCPRSAQKESGKSDFLLLVSQLRPPLLKI